MKIAKIFTPVVALALLVNSANAAVTGLDTEQTAADVACAGCIANDILINFDGNLRGQQLHIQLDSGEIYNTPATGAETAPADAFIGLVPELAFDSFVTIGGLTSGASQDVLVVGGAVDIPGAPGDKAMAGQVTSIAWAPGTGVDVPNGNRYPTARITLSGDANGVAKYFGSTSGGGQPLLRELMIIDGTIVPEPTTMALAGLSLIGLVAVRRRK